MIFFWGFIRYKRIYNSLSGKNQMNKLTLSKTVSCGENGSIRTGMSFRKILSLSRDGNGGLLTIGEVWDETKEKYFVCDKIGQSNSSSIYSVTTRKGSFVAKVQRKSTESSDSVESEYNIYTILNESFGDDAFLKPLEFVETKHLHAIILPPMGINLTQYVNSLRKKCINPLQAIGGFLNVLAALNKIHSIGFVHCNLTPSNLLVEPPKRRDQAFKIKLVDFSTACRYKGVNLDESQQPKEMPFNGSELYVSVLQMEKNTCSVTCDIYSGCLSILSVSSTNKLPWAQDLDVKTNIEKKLKFDCAEFLRNHNFSSKAQNAFSTLLKETVKGKQSGKSPHKAYFAEFKKIFDNEKQY